MKNNENLPNKTHAISSPDTFFKDKAAVLESRLDAIRISDAEAAKISKEHGIKLIRDKTLGFFKIGEVIKDLLEWNENVEAEVRDRKKEVLLSICVEKLESAQCAILDLRNFVSNPQGNTLFNKVLRILDDKPPDAELVRHLANAVCIMASNGNFSKLFEKHKYALGLIERLSPQALSILADFEHWPDWRLNGYSANGGVITSDWVSGFAVYYAETKNLKESDKVSRLRHALNTLRTDKLLIARLLDEGVARCELSREGKDLCEYLHYNKNSRKK